MLHGLVFHQLPGHGESDKLHPFRAAVLADAERLLQFRRFWTRGYFSTASGNVTDDIILQYLELHSERKPTGISR
jgi:REP element-mobilizing transposase RayT